MLYMCDRHLASFLKRSAYLPASWGYHEGQYEN